MAVTEPADPRAARADVELRLPADGAYVSVLRTLTAGLAARLDFTIDDIEDLRIAVGEACALVLAEADPGTSLETEFHLAPAELVVTVSVAASSPVTLDEDSFAWQVLTTLATDATVHSTAGRFTLRMTMTSSLADLPAVGSDG